MSNMRIKLKCVKDYKSYFTKGWEYEATVRDEDGCYTVMDNFYTNWHMSKHKLLDIFEIVF